MYEYLLIAISQGPCRQLWSFVRESIVTVIIELISSPSNYRLNFVTPYTRYTGETSGLGSSIKLYTHWIQVLRDL